MKRLFASASKLAPQRLSWLVDGALLVLIGLAVVQAAQAFLVPSVTVADVTANQTIKNQNTAIDAAPSTIGNVFFRDLTVSTQRNAPTANGGDIQLFGTRPAGKGLGTAIIAAFGQPQAVFKSGDVLGKGTALTAVYADRIEISRNGDLRSVYLEGTKKPQQRQLIQTANGSADKNERGGTKTAKAADTSTVQNAKKSVSFFTLPSMRAKDKNRRTQRRAPRNAPGGLNIFETFALSKTGDGYEVGADASSLAIKAAGLDIGDVITKINGRSVNDSRAMSDILRNTQRGGGLKLDVQRNGLNKTISINTNALRMAQMAQ